MADSPPTETVLVVDDDPRDLETMLRILRGAGFSPESAASGDDAVEILERRSFDLIVTDIVMRGTNGFEVVQRALKLNPNCICITATSFGSMESALNSLGVGAYSFTVKPVNAAEFLHVVRRGLEKQRLTKELLLRNEQLQKLNAELESRVQEATRKLQEMNRRVLSENVNLKEVDQLKTTFLGNVSHDLRNPLTTIRGYISYLVSEPAALSEEARQCLLSIDKASKHMEYLVRQLLEAAQLTSGTVRLEPAQLSARELIEECADLHKVQAEGAGLELRVEAVPSADLAFRGDRGRLLQVLSNLVGNACKFTPSGGKVVLRASREGDGVRFDVQDTGPGISPEHREKIFDRFFQTDARGSGPEKGLGLGLNIAKDIVALHGGRLWVDSEAGKGSCFHVAVPASLPKGV
jgi:signal transduction histidine kinase